MRIRGTVTPLIISYESFVKLVEVLYVLARIPYLLIYMDSTDMEFDGSATDASKNERDAEMDANTNIIDVDSTNETSDVPNPPKRRKRVVGSEEALVEMVIVDELPFKFVEGKKFKKFIDRLICASQPRFVVLSLVTVAREVLKLYVNEKKHLKDMFVNKKHRVSLITDCWTSGQNINYMVLTAHFIDSDWRLHKRILSFCPIENHKGDTIGKTIENNLKDWGIQRIMTLTVDNGSSNDTTIAYLLKRFNFGGEFLHVCCCAHILNLIVCDAFKEHNDCIERIQYVVRFIRSSPACFLKFKKCIEIEKISCKSYACLNVPTRWNSTYLMLEAAVKFEKAFNRLEDEDASYRHDLSPNKQDWTNAKMLIRLLKVFYDVTLEISGSLYTTSNMVFSSDYRGS
ncbi:zinc finger BED domain-containing protein RICESLEEPER 1-like [Benincasa hispida]|uniref:zinc finger BED domain-containing protein RICESLEEPER 1-like n=1 Tax=Benincasa hispida TaxID=102211 RepID=UPI0019006D58|nr:zinc finger BED domain-containing protein RICESLEEPER 1-like [Benincasa hispida]